MMTIVLFMAMALFTGLAVVALIVLGIAYVGERHSKDRGNQERAEKISQEIEKIDAMQTAGRISTDEARELKKALEDRRNTPAWGEFPRRRLCKSSDRILAGVCGGIAEWVGWDTTLVRLLYALCTLLIAAFPGIIAYIILALVMPAAPPVVPGDESAPVVRGTSPWIVLLILAACALAFFLTLVCVLAFLCTRIIIF